MLELYFEKADIVLNKELDSMCCKLRYRVDLDSVPEIFPTLS